MWLKTERSRVGKTRKQRERSLERLVTHLAHRAYPAAAPNVTAQSGEISSLLTPFTRIWRCTSHSYAMK
jgi:hypothetical protein